MTKPKHVLNLTGQGHFSRGTCTGCDWALKGHAVEIERVWGEYHQGGDRVFAIPKRVVVPKPTGDPNVDAVECLLIARLAASVTYKDHNLRLKALGTAEARSAILGGTHADALDYLSTLMARIAHISQRQRVKLMRPEITRDQQQSILEVE